MMLPATAYLASGGLQQFQRNRVLKFFLLKEAIDASDGQVGRIAAWSSALQTVAARSGSEIMALGSSFFWFYVDALYEDVARGTAIPEERFRLFLTQLFDSYFPLLGDADSVALDGSEEDVVLPSLGLRARSVGGESRLTRLTPGRVGVEGECQTLAIDINAPGEYGLGGVKLTPTARLLLGVDSLLDDALANKSIADLSAVECREFAALLGEAFDLIRAADGGVAEQMDSIVRWYFPIKTHDKRTVHNSFTVASLNGVIFLSESYSFLPLAEALVHEFYHNELWMAMTVEKHLGGSAEEVLYSPWREDARPLLGLYHGSYVFTGLLEFFAAAGREPALREHHAHFQARRCFILHQLRTALAQVRFDALEERGREFVESLAEIVRRHGEELQGTGLSLPEIQKDHWHRWCARYPELVGSATPPAGL